MSKKEKHNIHRVRLLEARLVIIRAGKNLVFFGKSFYVFGFYF